MRKISVPQMLVFLAMLGLIAGLSILTVAILLGRLPLGDFRGLVLAGATLAVGLVYALGTYRAFLHFMPLESGDVPQNSRKEFIYHVYLLFFLMFFYPVIRSGVLPMPVMRLLYQALGARLGPNTYSAGIICDPIFVSMGSNCIVGTYALIVPHAIEGAKLSHEPIRIGNNVTIGGTAIVLAGTVIEDGALIAAGSVVRKGTHVGAGEIWGGVPARKLKDGDPRPQGATREQVDSHPLPGTLGLDQSIGTAFRTIKNIGDPLTQHSPHPWTPSPIRADATQGRRH